ncbi:magnesium transporter CorA family protein [Parageobacillus sp. KH3-4]|jgi:magnesium transporter|uniref:magnesium transporter CorA family protein n=1 Tax=Parageobacillus sp. KH3-4 TaxID=2916802 RepID=UPI001FCC4962|nr:magnesium transporter CorA family protein [Parageobacillus sp. KH3-4]BDG47073.1 cobalt/magnesium transport protein CorA [Parageobacillus sp. KH3-4]
MLYNDMIANVNNRYAPAGKDACWLHFTKASKTDLERLLQTISVHPLAKQRLLYGTDIPMVDEYERCLFISLFIIRPRLQIMKIQMIVTEQYMISYAEENDPLIEQVKEKLLHHREHASHPGYVLYYFLDVSTRRFLQVIDDIADRIQSLEKQVFKTPFANEIGRNIYRWKVWIHELRQITEAQEEMMKLLQHTKFPYIHAETNPYMQDVAGRFSRITAALDKFKETLSGIFDLQLSLKSDHMNVIMKTLTLVSVIFMPMTFIAGVYGMNFEAMPELKWKYGYVYALLLMAALGISIALYFKKKGWWGETDTKEK